MADRREIHEREEGNGFQDTIRFFEEMGSDYHVVNDCGENLLHTLASREIIKDWIFDKYGSNLTLFKFSSSMGWIRWHRINRIVPHW